MLIHRVVLVEFNDDIEIANFTVEEDAKNFMSRIKSIPFKSGARYYQVKDRVFMDTTDNYKVISLQVFDELITVKKLTQEEHAKAEEALNNGTFFVNLDL